MVETTENYHRIPVARKKKNAEIRTITIAKGIKALYDKKNKAILTYLFDVNQFTMKQAKAWVKSHKGSAAHLVMAENLSLVEDIEKDIESKKNQVIDEVVKLIESRKEL